MRFLIMFESAFLILLLFSNSDLGFEFGFGFGFGFVSGQSEKELLLQFRSSLTYDSSASTKLVHWNESGDFCRWAGVECDSSGRVSGLDLSGEPISAGINGTSALLKLSHLRVLTMSSCGLSGVVPRQLLLMKSLREIDLSNNRALEGSLPEFPVNGSLEKLVLSYTRFSGNVPDSIGNLRMLSNLDLRSCSFSGEIPSRIKNLNLLVYLDLSVNQFSGNVPSFASLKNLQVLNLYRNRLTGKIPDSLWTGLENLGFLDLGENSLQGEIPPSFFALPLLKSLHISNNSFSGSIKVSTNTSSSPLEVLDLSLNNLEGSVPRIFLELRNLSTLSLSSNKFGGSLQLTDFSKLKNLVNLDLSYNKLSLRVAEEARLSELLPRLGTLMLASCNLQKLPNLRNQSSLMMLDLSQNLLQGEIPNWLWRVGDDGFLFRFLNLSHNRFSHLQQPYAMRGLDSLDLHSNILAGEIPTPPPSVFYVDFSSNNFTSIPLNIGNILKRVMTFSAADNRIAGAIPASFSNATGLQALNLSRNALSGHIPAALGKLARLGSLDLSFNALDGKIPVELRKFPASSFAGNDGLCGPPLNRSCHEREMYVSSGALLD